MTDDNRFLNSLDIRPYDADAFAAEVKKDEPPPKDPPPVAEPETMEFMVAVDEEGLAHVSFSALQELVKQNHAFCADNERLKASLKESEEKEVAAVNTAINNARAAREWRLWFWLLFGSLVLGVVGIEVLSRWLNV